MVSISKSEKPSLREKLLPFQGNWCLPWVIQRYFRSSLSGWTLKKLANSARAFVEMKRGLVRVGSAPSVLRIEPTNLCNLHCPRCSCGIGTDPRPKGFLELDDYRQVLEQNRKSAVVLRLDGNGEPTLHPRIFDLISIGKTYGLTVSMSSNLCTPNSREAVAFVKSGLDRLVVAVDGSTQENYARYRVGGDLAQVLDTLDRIVAAKKDNRSRTPLVEVQFLDWDYNRHEIPEVRSLARRLGADKFEVIRPDWAVTHAEAQERPRRCFWLWFVLSVDCKLNYHSCTNAWTLPWPKLNLRDVSTEEFWNHDVMQEARRYNLDRSSRVIASDETCHCNQCSDMLIANRPPGYVCE